MEDKTVDHFLDLRVNDRFQLLQFLGAGSFGRVYLGRDVQTGDDVAIKLEHCDVKEEVLSQEIMIYESLQAQPGFPEVYWHGDKGHYSVMVFELLGPSLEDLLQYCGGRFSMKTTLMLMDQLLRRVERLHAIGFHHRDIKPENFLLWSGKSGNVVYMTNLGLAADYRVGCEPGQTGHIAVIGTCRYASINGHLGGRSSCRDDLQSLGYMALYFLRGFLPWQGLQVPNHEVRLKRILQQKQQIGVDELCKDLPHEFAMYMSYLTQMRYLNKPDYPYLRKLFDGLFRRLGFVHDNIFDWTIREFERLSCQSPVSETGDRDPARATGRN